MNDFRPKKIDMVEIKNLIGGELVAASSKKTLENLNPATGERIGSLPDSNEKDVDKAVAAAEAAFPIWSKFSLDRRADCLSKLADLILENLEKMAEAETRDSGKTIRRSLEIEIPRAAQNFRFFAAAALQFGSESHAMPGEALNFTLRQPIGLVGCISPWNLPLYLFTWKIAPALAAGNCVIAKPSEVTPLTAFLLSKLVEKAGFPAGTLQILHGDGPKCGAAIVAHPKIKAISFTGSTRAGAEIARVAAPMFKKLSLELGGKNPTLIFSDVENWDEMIETVVRSSFQNQGQICLCGSRILVESSIFERFRADFLEKSRVLKVGDPFEKNSDLGAMVSKMHFEKVMSCIETAKNEGGKLLAGGQKIDLGGALKNGFFIEPTIFENLGASCRTNQEEIFGPVVTLQPFSTENEALELANASGYGLAATVWTSNLSRTHRLAERLEAGIVWVNCWMLRDLRTPFGGQKNSGVGREGGAEAMRFFTEAKNVCIRF